MSKFTKGPWHFVQYACYGQIQTEPYYDDHDDLLNEEDYPNSAANGQLAAASPLLLHELQECLKDLIVQQANIRKDIKGGNKRWEGVPEILDERIKSIKHAIKQATGE